MQLPFSGDGPQAKIAALIARGTLGSGEPSYLRQMATFVAVTIHRM
ncbi:MAG TPA: hypothetical protein VK035_01000 [Kiloniellales bacterium]|nr:hypothetical protein [Kiloniellales bacterium]